VKKWIVVGAAFLAGCAGQPAEHGSGAAGTQAESESLQRARAFTDLAAAYYARAQYKVALDELRKAISADDRYGPAYNVYGLIYMDLDEDKLAEDNFRHAIDLNHKDSEAHNNFGWFLCTRGRYKEGLEQFSAALSNPLYTTPEQAMTNAGQPAEVAQAATRQPQYDIEAGSAQFPPGPARRCATPAGSLRRIGTAVGGKPVAGRQVATQAG
jgi:type IV pilus assembly protein PilF